MVAEMTHGDDVICDAEGLFIAIPPERLGLPPDAAEVAGAGRPNSSSGALPPTAHER
jgi:hypothetical protein